MVIIIKRLKTKYISMNIFELSHLNVPKSLIVKVESTIDKPLK